VRLRRAIEGFVGEAFDFDDRAMRLSGRLFTI